ncbi:unnamed protein product [Orchesella dallaii]|uniref:2'-5'-oligoadenylate synthetase 1 domain-containing protein n=1 Tax=Orchesella dallaii TaxID=48710 RepID=A0ABP1S6E1_9HEXA
MGNLISRQDPRKVIDNRLEVFGESLQCEEQYYEDGNLLAEKVFNTLKQHSHYFLDSYQFAGSFGKETDVIDPDLDLVVLVNKCRPPLKGVLNEFEKILRANEDYLQICPGSYKKSIRCLKFAFRNGISVDLLPAPNLSYDEKENVLALMRNNDELAHLYNPSFVEDQIAFMEDQDNFTHTLIRLSKFWLKSLNLGQSFSGGSAMMELIAVAAAQELEKDGERSVSRSFIKVLDMVIKLKTLKIAFKLDNDGEWRRVSPADLNCRNKSWLVPTIIGKYKTLKKRNFIVDPANPFQNFLEGKCNGVLKKLKKFAVKTRSVFCQILEGNGQCGSAEFIQELFEPMVENLSNEDAVSLPTSILVSYEVPCTSVYNDVKVWNEEIMKDPKVSRAVELLKKNLHTVVHSTVKGNEDMFCESNEVQNRVSQLLESKLEIPLESTSYVENHDSYSGYDAMVRIPYVIDDEVFAVYVSLKWESSCFLSQLLKFLLLFALWYKLREPHVIYIDSVLVRFGERLKCPEKYYDDGKQMAEKVFETLVQHSTYSLDSFHFGGSFGKKTDVIEPDLDLVVLINNCHPPLNNVLHHFEQILRSNEDPLQIFRGVYKQTDRALQFSFRNGISVDLLPAANIQDDERNAIFQTMVDYDRYSYYYNPSFVENQIAFLKCQDSFTHTLIRLLKFWLGCLHLGEKFRGGSAIMELLAVAAITKERLCEEKSISRAIRRVLDMVRNLDSLKLAFYRVNNDDDEDEKWERVQPKHLNYYYSTILVPTVVGKVDILLRESFIIDPANPLQDFLEGKSESVIETLKEYATTTRSYLDMISSGSEKYSLVNFIYDFFYPMPEDLTEDCSLLLPDDFLLSYKPCSSVYNKLKIWNHNDIMDNKDALRAVKVLKKNLITVVHSIVKENPARISMDHVKVAVEKLIEDNLQVNLCNAPRRYNRNRQNEIEWYDVMVRVPIPYAIDGEESAVCLFLRWD